MDRINVCAVEAIDRCSRDVQRVAVAWSDIQEATVRRVGASQEQLIAQTCAQAGLDILQIGKPESLSVSLRRGDSKKSAEMREAGAVQCPLGLDLWTSHLPLLCALYACDPFENSCYAILATAEAVLAEERPP